MEKALELGIKVLVLTNDPANVPRYNSEVFPELERLAQKKKLEIRYHEGLTVDFFSELLRAENIDTLICVGFSSNMCVIGRPLGIIPMCSKGFRMFFIPEASSAIEFQETWETGELHKYTTIIISQFAAEIIQFDDFMKLTPS